MLDVERVWDTLIALLLALTGGFAQILSIKKHQSLKWGFIFSELFIAGFCGMMVLSFARASGLSGDWIGLVCGIAGWTSPKLLHALTGVAERILGLKIIKSEKETDSHEN